MSASPQTGPVVASRHLPGHVVQALQAYVCIGRCLQVILALVYFFGVQAAAKLASGLVSTVWHVVDDMVVTPALQVGPTAVH